MIRGRDCYLRTYRKRNGLTQKEVAFLLGGATHAKISRFERSARRPNLEAAFACQAIFDTPVQDLFPAAYTAVELQVIKRARVLAKQLYGKKPTPRIERKLQLLRIVIARKRRAQ